MFLNNSRIIPIQEYAAAEEIHCQRLKLENLGHPEFTVAARGTPSDVGNVDNGCEFFDEGASVSD